MLSPFLSPGTTTKENQLASLHLRRDQALPTLLSTAATSLEEAGYAEGNVTNTRFGSFPHSTLLGLRWGSQIRASKVDTGTRGRKVPRVGKKRKSDALSRDTEDDPNDSLDTLKEAITASSGFLHVLPPTPENWTTSLPHRTQVVYTPDYSYILHRIRARPGSILLEAGSGSGSFTHAAARAVFDGYPDAKQGTEEILDRRPRNGKVFTYEFHAERQQKMAQEMLEHGLESIVTSTHRDVYNEGFLLVDPLTSRKISPRAKAVFLDLPAPWSALPHLTRDEMPGSPSPLDPSQAVHVCTFSPCIEQAQKTISALRRLGWLEIEMVEMQHKRIDVRREYTGLQYEGMRGVNAVAVNVEEALAKLREVEQRAREFHTGERNSWRKDGLTEVHPSPGKSVEAQKTLFKGGKLVHRSEPELKTHTSYLVFAILPRIWSEEDENITRARWTSDVSEPTPPAKSKKELGKEARQKASKIREGVSGAGNSKTRES
jgi:tRNA (adenine57-N1/adenine58-N1)-methyltransferase catalytic subunit